MLFQWLRLERKEHFKTILMLGETEINNQMKMFGFQLSPHFNPTS